MLLPADFWEVWFYSHVNYSVTKMLSVYYTLFAAFYSHVNYSVTKIDTAVINAMYEFYSHVNYSVTKINLRQGL